MSSAPLLVSLQNQILLNRLAGELTAQGISFEAVTDGQDLLRAITGPTDVLVDPRTAPAGLDPAAFIASIASRARGGKVLAQCSDAVETDSLVDLGASDVFGDQTLHG